MKQKHSKIQTQSGFTIIELLVVISMMVVISTVLVIDFSRQRSTRSMVIAKNEMVTNLRKVQSYMLSSKNLPTGESVKYYVVSLTTGDDSYQVNAIDSDYSYHDTVENIKLPTGVTIEELLVQEAGQTNPTPHKCLQVIYSAPYGKMYARGVDTCSSDILDVVQDPVQIALLNEREATIKLTNTYASTGHSVLITPTTGLITPQYNDPTISR